MYVNCEGATRSLTPIAIQVYIVNDNRRASAGSYQSRQPLPMREVGEGYNEPMDTGCYSIPDHGLAGPTRGGGKLTASAAKRGVSRPAYVIQEPSILLHNVTEVGEIVTFYRSPHPDKLPRQLLHGYTRTYLGSR